MTVIHERDGSRASLGPIIDTDNPSDQEHQKQSSTPPKLLVGTFALLLGSLLLSQNVLVAEVARDCVVELFKRMATNDTRDRAIGERDREMLERGLIEGVIIALARLGESPSEEKMQEPHPQGQEPEMEGDSNVQASSASSFELPTSLPIPYPSALQPEPPLQHLYTHCEASPWVPSASPAPSSISPSVTDPPHGGQEYPYVLSPPPSTMTASPSPLPNVPTDSAPGSLTSPPTSVHSESTGSTPSLSSTVNSASSSSELEFVLCSSSGSESTSHHPSIRRSSRSDSNAGDDDYDATIRSPDPSSPAAIDPRFAAALPEDEFNLRLPIPLLKSADPNALPARSDELHAHGLELSSLSTSLPAAASSVSPLESGRKAASAFPTPAGISATQLEPDTDTGSVMGAGIESIRMQRASTPAYSDDSGDVTPKIEKGDVLASEVAATAPDPAPPPTNVAPKDQHLSRTLSHFHDPRTISPSLPEFSRSDTLTSQRSRSASTSAITEASSRPRNAEPQIGSADVSLAAPIEPSSESDPTPITFPAAESSIPSAATAMSAPTPANAEVVGDEAAVGCVASMSLMAAVAASGYLPEYAKGMFVAEVARVGTDPIYWVRREAAYALGALAKVVDDEMLLEYLVGLRMIIVPS